MKTSNFFAILMMAVIGFGTATFSAQVEATPSWVKKITNPCTGKTGRERTSCEREVERDQQRWERERDRDRAQRDRIIDRFIKEYVRLEGYKATQVQHFDEAQRLTDRKVFLEMKRDTQPLTREEQRELSQIDRGISSAVSKAAGLNDRILRSGTELAKMERDYKSAGGRDNLRVVAQREIAKAYSY